MTRIVKFSECVEYMIKGPFGSDMKKSLYVPKGDNTYKVYIQGNAIQQDEALGDYYVSEEYFHDKLERFEVHPGDYIITCDGTLGKFIKLSDGIERGVISSSLLLLKLNEEIINDKYFELLWEHTMLATLASQARNACLVHLPSAKAIGDLEVKLPEMSEQLTIAEKAFSVKRNIAYREKQQELLDELIKARFVEMFGDERNLMNWPIIKLSELCDLQNGYAFKSDDYINESSVLNCRMSNIRPNGGFDSEYHPKYLPEDYWDKFKAYRLYDGDVIIAMTDMASDPKILGVPTIVRTNGHRFLLNQRVGKLDFFCDNRMNRVFLMTYLNQIRIRKELAKQAGGSTQINVGKPAIMSIDVFEPPIEAQNEFVRFVEQVDKSKVVVQKSIDETQILFNSLIQEYFG